MRLGVHVSIAGSIALSVDRCVDRGCNTFQIFTRNPRGWASKSLDSEDVTQFITKVKKHGIDPAVAHMPYLPNLASPEESVYLKSKESQE